jgi:NTP pyrophosphatase (non-canonical NTP hydrolase)
MQQLLADFADRRDWGRFHTPKNLAMALAGEAGELAAEFQWLDPEESARVMADPAKAAAVRLEMADVLSYLLRLADVLDVDLEAALREKVAINEARFPAGG